MRRPGSNFLRWGGSWFVSLLIAFFKMKIWLLSALCCWLGLVEGTRRGELGANCLERCQPNSYDERTWTARYCLWIYYRVMMVIFGKSASRFWASNFASNLYWDVIIDTCSQNCAAGLELMRYFENLNARIWNIIPKLPGFDFRLISTNHWGYKAFRFGA